MGTADLPADLDLGLTAASALSRSGGILIGARALQRAGGIHNLYRLTT